VPFVFARPAADTSCMYAYNSEDKFAAAGPAAAAVLQHRATNPEIKDGPWDFDRGTVSKDGRSSA